MLRAFPQYYEGVLRSALFLSPVVPWRVSPAAQQHRLGTALPRRPSPLCGSRVCQKNSQIMTVYFGGRQFNVINSQLCELN